MGVKQQFEVLCPSTADPFVVDDRHSLVCLKATGRGEAPANRHRSLSPLVQYSQTEWYFPGKAASHGRNASRATTIVGYRSVIDQGTGVVRF